jgi:hypothetical protein
MQYEALNNRINKITLRTQYSSERREDCAVFGVYDDAASEIERRWEREREWAPVVGKGTQCRSKGGHVLR